MRTFSAVDMRASREETREGMEGCSRASLRQSREFDTLTVCRSGGNAKAECQSHCGRCMYVCMVSYNMNGMVGCWFTGYNRVVYG